VGLVPLLVFIARRPQGPAGRWAATRGGILAGTIYFGLQLHWLPVALAQYSLLAAPAYVLSVAVLAALTGAFGWGTHYTLERLGLPLVLPAALLWTALEWVQGRAGAFAFPWLGLGHALTPWPTLAGAADLVGGRGLTLWVVAVNGLIAMALLRRHSRRGAAAGAPIGVGRPVGLAVAALLLAAAPAGYGLWRVATLELVPAARVAVVQPNIPQRIRLDARLALDTSVTALTRLTLQARGPAPDLVAWPEVALTAELERSPALAGAVRELSARVGAPILVGAYGLGTGVGGLRNSAFLVQAAGPPWPRYDKRRLVPFVERVPLFPASGRFGGLEPGRAAPVFTTAEIRGGDTARGGGGRTPSPDPGAETGPAFGVLICYEAIFPGLARRYRRDGADFLVNITNDGWFGRDAWWGRTAALWQHPAHLVMRAVENRMGAARAANTGISMFVDPLGRVHQATTLFVPDVRTHAVTTTPGLTLYSRWGDWLASLAVILALMMLAAARNRDPQSRE
jgi:apolipoprotein N-acyltransferase